MHEFLMLEMFFDNVHRKISYKCGRMNLGNEKIEGNRKEEMRKFLFLFDLFGFFSVSSARMS